MNAPHTQSPDDQLLLLIRQGNADAYGELWRRYVKAARAAAWQYRATVDPDDLVAEAYSSILRAIQGGRGPTERFKPYLYATVRNLALRELRRTHHFADVSIADLAEELADESLPTEDELADRQLAATALGRLPERWRAVLWHTEVEGRSTLEVGQLMGLEPTAVAVLAFRARAALREAWLSSHLTDRDVASGCRTVSSRLPAHVLGTLSERLSDRVEAHLLTCRECARDVAELRRYASRVQVSCIDAARDVSAQDAAFGGVRARGGPPCRGTTLRSSSGSA